MQQIKWSETTDKDKIELLITHVLKWQFLPSTDHERKPTYPVVWWDEENEDYRFILAQGKRPQDFDPLHSMDDVWLIVEKMVVRMGFQNIGFHWHGPVFKPENQYLTAEGYPLGTTCWYVIVETSGSREFVCAKTPQDAICIAALRACGVEVIEE